MADARLCWLSATELAALFREKIVGRRFDDATVLRASAAFERARPWAQHRPRLD